MALYWVSSGPMATTAAQATLNTGTSIKTLLQIATPSTRMLRVTEWGISFAGSAAATPVKVELIQTDVAATVTAHVASGVQPYDDPNAPASSVTLSTSGTGYDASAEGTITATRTGDAQQISPTTLYVKQFPLGREFKVPVSKFLRVRAHAGASVAAWTYVIFEEV